MNTPNLFSFATGELSQDAFLCWLLSWADPQFTQHNEPLNKTASLLIDRLFSLAELKKPASVQTVKVVKQYKHMDVLVIVNDEFALIVEDKTFTKHHSGQLERYLAEITKTYPREKAAAIYLKTGDQANYSEIEAAGFRCLRRKDLLEVLEAGRTFGVSSDIFRDYHNYVLGIEQSVLAFRSKPPGEWDWNCWTGFFVELQKQLDDGAWDYVANPSGGFMGFWWHGRGNSYLLLEQDRLCFKIEEVDESLQSTEWDRWHERLLSVDAEKKLKRPSRRRSASNMTVALWDGDFRRFDGEGKLDLEATVEVLKHAERILDKAT